MKISVGQPLEVTGWGVNEQGTTSKQLRKATVPYVANATCNKRRLSIIDASAARAR